MRILDFFSESPSIYIFQKEANKTKFGGFLFLLFSVLILLISSSYIIYFLIDYGNGELYEIQSSIIKIPELSQFHYNGLTFEKEIDPRFDPNIDFVLELFKTNKNKKAEKLNEKFVIKILKNNKFEKIQRNKIYNKKVSEILIGIFFQGSNDEYDTFFKNLKKEKVVFVVGVEGFNFTHQNRTSPIIKNETCSTYYFDYKKDKTILIDLYWENVIYKDKKGIYERLYDYLRNKSNEYMAGYIDYSNFYFEDQFDIKEEYDEDEDICLGLINFVNENKEYLEYKREKKSFFDVLASIGGLIPTFKFIFLRLLLFYSKNFDNYKIINRILLKKKKINLTNNDKTFKELKMNNIENKSDKYSKNNLASKDSNNDNKSLLLTKNYSNKKNLIINDIDTVEENNIDSLEENKFINNETKQRSKKLSFIQFFFNNIYCKCCHRIKEQEFLNLCNEIIYEYFSVDSIIYNQIMFENLLKDYQWNNEELNSIENNELMIKLKNHYSLIG